MIVVLLILLLSLMGNEAIHKNSLHDLRVIIQQELKLADILDVLGIILTQKEENLDADIEALIRERQDARKAKNFARADEIRDQLLQMGIVLEDTREGVKWKRA